MTRIEKSDAQLDAEAEAPQLGLRWLIVDLRRAMRNETPERLHNEHTSKTPGDELDAKGWTAYPDEGGVGLPFSARMHRYLGTNSGRSSKHPWDLGPNPMFRPAMASIVDTSEWCHARHTSHQIPGSTRSLCAQLIFEVGYLGQEPEDVAWLHDLPLEQTESMLVGALRHARTKRIDDEQRLSREPGSETPLPELSVIRARRRNAA